MSGRSGACSGSWSFEPIDGCVAALADDDRDGYLACYAPDAASSISADEAGGTWTEEYQGIDAIAAGLAGHSDYVGIVRSGPMVMISDMVRYPFRGSSPACRVGIDVLQLEAAQDRILGHWAFCGPE